MVAALACGCGRGAFETVPDGLPRDQFVQDAFENDRQYSTFSPCPTELMFVGQSSCAGNRLAVTPDLAQASGAAWLTIPYPTNVSTAFAADGAAIVLQNDPRGTTAIGGTGGELAAGAIKPSLALELDTFSNVNEVAGEHVGLDLDGIVLPGGPATMAPFRLSDGTPFTVWLDYDKNAHVAAVYLARMPPKPASPIVTVDTDLTHLGSRMFIGFTAATGSDHESHEVLALAVDVTP